MNDQNLTDHFTLWELTKTNSTDFQETNRTLEPDQVTKLTEVAHLLEAVRALLEVPIDVHSGYRCLALNLETRGSSPTSQHVLCEAADFVPKGVELGDAFRTLWRAVSDAKLHVGQLIFETEIRSYGATSWIHISLGAPWRPQDKCNQVMRKEHGIYTMLGKFGAS
jgi:zinc D-Ala-D-Ala carboxypeptidase